MASRIFKDRFRIDCLGGKKKEKRVQNTNVIKEKTGLFSYSKKDKEEKAETAADNNQARDEKNVHSRKAAGFGQPQANIETEMSDDKTETEGILRLELVESSGKGSGCPKTVELDLTKRALTVGRLDADGQAQADYCFDSAVTIISRKHFRVEWSDGQYRINDLGSVNGTYVNEQKLGPNVKRCLQTGDCIKISGGGKGKVCYRVC